jgi:sec-independent protein translocase protein TatC
MAVLPKRSPRPLLPLHAPQPQAAMPLLEHLNELRVRLFRAAIALVIGTAAGIVLAPEVLVFLQQPYGRAFVTLGPTSGVVVYFRVALMVGASLAIPMITYQIWMFVMPGLMARERRFVLLSLPAVTLLFVVGVVFAWAILIPPALGFLEGFQPTLFRPEWTAELYLSFVTTLLFWMGVAFELPLVFFVVSLLGMITPRALLQNWRIAVVVAAVAAALITPTVDPVNMSLVMVPLLALYALSTLLVALGARLYRRRTAEPAAGQTQTAS